jgi:uncharacterized repeat protein (TIGR02543 family)
MKKFITLALILAIILSTYTVGSGLASAAESSDTATVNGVSCPVGSIISFNVYLKVPEKFEDLQAYAEYSSNGLKLENYTFSDELQKGSFIYNPSISGVIKYNVSSIMNYLDFTSKKVLAKFDFKVIAKGDWSIKHVIEILDTVSGVSYSETASEHKSLSGMVSSTTKLASFVIKYNANGGVNPPASQSKIQFVNAVLSKTIPTRTGYKFLGWATSKNSKTVAYKAGSTYSKESNITLYAVWQAKKSQTITGVKTKYTKSLSVKSFKISPKSSAGGITYSTSNKKVATVSSTGKVTVKGVGKAVITIKSKENSVYKSAVKKVQVIVNPKNIKSSAFKLKKASSKSIKAVWSKNKTVTNYYLQYSLKKNFAGAKNVKISSSKSSYTIKGLKKGKTYYVRIRCCKKVSGTKYYSTWTTKKIKVK